MSIIARPRPRIKSTRHVARESRPFGQGILASRPTHRLACTIADLEWAAQEFGDQTQPDSDFDRMALEAAMLDRYTAGYTL